ncbi:NAD-dependent protein deacetylase [Halorientalis sp. IM1011]|uniref:SIR2 family NAD-dependent protein deacylase n=1 Tax=Halorientalis sp. IM1011 TaxID=1932360 RepID=UPI00097CCDA7|nr:NAD-dependent deacylase [Halorientalis sp. IM1011]AQL44231.1 NAD-dependent protein deacetylase [Halorientalis sp. IM1011]
MSVDESDLRAVAGAIRDAESVVALTGAGVSTASGIPDFRGEDGIWERNDPMDFHIDRFRADPAGFWDDRVDLQSEAFDDGDVAPNAAHEALADLESAGYLDTVVTQNIDGLHQTAGSENVIEIHGSAARVVCRDCGQRSDADPAMERARDGELPPTCEDCNGTLKPDTVLFGEQLPEHALMRSQTRAEEADVFLAVGSSLTVEPAASLPRVAAEQGATLVLVNLESTPLSGRADYDFRADVTEALPRLRRVVEE